MLTEYGTVLTQQVNRLFGNKEPWQVAAITTSTVLSLIWFWNLITEDECLLSRSRKKFFKLIRKIPAIQTKIDKELVKFSEDFENERIKSTKGMKYVTELPFIGIENDEILQKVDEYLNLGNYNWQGGQVSGAVYYYSPEILDLVTKVYGKASYTNPLHIDVFPGICKMEAEVVRISATLFNGGENSCGTMTTGGTESIMMACKAYRDYGRETKGITRPNIVAPVTVHAAVDKAGQYFGVFVKSIKVNPITMEVDIAAMERAINRNTIMLIGSAPNFPYGTMDDIEAIAKLGKKYNIPVHVDACLGGFVIVFMKRAGYNIKPFDFSLDGITSISADTHKYGFTPKGSSVILYSDKKYRRYQYTVTTDWPGGVYGSPTVNGSRAGGIIAATWATLLRFGQDGYTETTKRIIDTARHIEKGLREIKGIFVYGTPATTVIAIGSKEFDIFRLSDSMGKFGWNLNALQFPSGIHICVTDMHTTEGIAAKFLKDIKVCVAELLQNPLEMAEGKMAIYGVAQSVPDRAIIGDVIRYFLDSNYYTSTK